MPTLLRFQSSPLGLHRPLPRHCADMAHGNIFRWLDAGDPALARRVHDGSTRKPFALGPLEAAGRRWVELRMGVLQPALLPALHAGLSAQPWLLVGADQLALQRVDAMADLPEIALPDRPLQFATLSFDTPTLFNTKTGPFPWPDAFRMLQSWALAWQDNVPPAQRLGASELEGFLAWVRSNVLIDDANIRLGQQVVERNAFNGFVGTVTLALQGQDQHARHAARLIHYAPFCGTGYKSAHGLGHTHLLALNRKTPPPRPPVVTRGGMPLWVATPDSA